MFGRSEARQESGPPVEPVDPPAEVWVNLERLFPVHVDDPHKPCNGLDVSRDVPGLVSEWTRSSMGARLGLVTYQLTTRDRSGRSRSSTTCRIICSSGGDIGSGRSGDNGAWAVYIGWFITATVFGKAFGLVGSFFTRIPVAQSDSLQV